LRDWRRISAVHAKREKNTRIQLSKKDKREIPSRRKIKNRNVGKINRIQSTEKCEGL